MTMSAVPEALYVARTMQVLELLAFQSLSAPQVAATLQIHPRTARRVLVRLYEEGYLTRSDDARRRYAPSLRVVSLAAHIAARSPLATQALPFVDRLHDDTGADAHLAVPSYVSALCMVHAGDSCRARVHPRELVPAHASAIGKALRRPLERPTVNTIVDPLRLGREADETRVRGYAVEIGELQDGVSAVAAPVFADDEAIAALGASGPDLEIEAVGARVVALAAELTDTIADSDA
jgi:DNA-binding IclR family transcriptional regulator